MRFVNTGVFVMPVHWVMEQWDGSVLDINVTCDDIYKAKILVVAHFGWEIQEASMFPSFLKDKGPAPPELIDAICREGKGN